MRDGNVRSEFLAGRMPDGMLVARSGVGSAGGEGSGWFGWSTGWRWRIGVVCERERESKVVVDSVCEFHDPIYLCTYGQSITNTYTLLLSRRQ